MDKFVEVKEKSGDAEQKIKDALQFLKDTPVYVGVPENKTVRRKEDGEKVAITNAELMFIHTNGSPRNNIPARPVIEPAIEDDKERISKMFKDAGQTMINQGKDAAMKKLKLIGMRAQNVCRAWFVNPKNNWPPNSPATIAAKRAKGATKPRPLIDTGQLRRSIIYFVETKGGRKT